MREITIVGGGLAGLGLGIALRRRGVPATVHEAGAYPRHRVCGEFLSGICAETVDALGLSDVLAQAVPQRTTAWFGPTGVFAKFDLPSPARGISRHLLDRGLRDVFVALGGRMLEHSRQRPVPGDGLVWCAGRTPAKGDWIGLKCHFESLPTEADLEMHVGRGGYIGLARVGDRRVNVCGLFRREIVRGRGEDVLQKVLRRSGLAGLADRLHDGDMVPGSAAAVAGFQLGRQPAAVPGLLALGDAHAMIPPFTGNGMSMALESAVMAADPIAAFARGERDWADARRAVTARLERAFASRLCRAHFLHPFLTSRRGQTFFAAMSICRLVPFRTIFRLLR